MNVALNRKRSRLALDSDDEDDSPVLRREASPALSTLSDTLKRSKTQCELDELRVVSAEGALSVDLGAMLASEVRREPAIGSWEVHDNWAGYRKGESIVVLCVQGNVRTHYDLLCSALPSLYAHSPALQAFVLCSDPESHVPSTASRMALPMLEAITPANNHFVRLGLLHPLGGGKLPLDALVVLDPRGKRRMMLPFGWGAGKHAGTLAGKGIQARYVELLRHCVEVLEAEGSKMEV